MEGEVEREGSGMRSGESREKLWRNWREVETTI